MIYYIECVKNEPTDPSKMDVRYFVDDEQGNRHGAQLIIPIPEDDSKQGIEEAVDTYLSNSGMNAEHGDWEDLR